MSVIQYARDWQTAHEPITVLKSANAIVTEEASVSTIPITHGALHNIHKLKKAQKNQLKFTVWFMS